MEITVWEWFEQCSFHYQDFRGLLDGADRLPLTTTLVLPTRNTAETIGPILDTVARLNDRTGLIEQVVVVDADSPDGTAEVARRHGAEVYSENELLPEYGRAHGKGDAMWRGLSVARGDIVMFADTDSTDFRDHFVYGTLGPLLTDPKIQFTKAAFRRPFSQDGQPGGQAVVDGGGRVTELMAKPLLNFFYPELTGFVQPLAGEFAAHRELLNSIPFATGYGVEIAMMVDVLNRVGLSAMAQVDLETRQNRHQPLFDLTRMSSAVLRALGRRVQLAGRGALTHDPSEVLALPQRDVYLHAVGTGDGLRLDEHLVELLERPPLANVLAAGTERETVA